MSICYYHIVNRTKQNKGGAIMDIDIIWDNEELEAIEELNEIFNL